MKSSDFGYEDVKRLSSQKKGEDDEWRKEDGDNGIPRVFKPFLSPLKLRFSQREFLRNDHASLMIRDNYFLALIQR